jgi:hypothetical protein
VSNAVVTQNRRLPLVKRFVAASRELLLDADLRQVPDVAQSLTQTARVRASRAEQVGEPGSGRAFGFHQPVHQVRKCLWRVTGPCHRLYAQMVGHFLSLFCVVGSVPLLQPNSVD